MVIQMKLGVLSDTHNSLTNLETALKFLRREGVDTIIHCGDLTTPETAATLRGFRVIHAIGNGDYDNGQIRQVLIGLNPQNFSGALFSGEIGGVKLAVTHGIQASQVRQLTQSGEYRYVFVGHSHRRRDEQIGATRLVNPGALGGVKVEERSIYLLDLETSQGEFFKLSQLTH